MTWWDIQESVVNSVTCHCNKLKKKNKKKNNLIVSEVFDIRNNAYWNTTGIKTFQCIIFYLSEISWKHIYIQRYIHMNKGLDSRLGLYWSSPRLWYCTATLHTYIAIDMHNNSSVWLNNLNNYCQQMKGKTKRNKNSTHIIWSWVQYLLIYIKHWKKELLHTRLNSERERERERLREREREREKEGKRETQGEREGEREGKRETQGERERERERERESCWNAALRWGLTTEYALVKHVWYYQRENKLRWARSGPP